MRAKNDVWKLNFSDYPSVELDFNSDIKPVIGSTEMDYSKAINKPSINGVVLEGNKTNDDILISSISNSEIEELLK